MRKWRHFLHGSSAVAATDRSCLKDLTIGKGFSSKRLVRYAVDLTEHNLKIVYRPGRDHHLPDLMSRMSHLTPGSVEARAVGDAAMGMTAGMVEGKC